MSVEDSDGFLSDSSYLTTDESNPSGNSQSDNCDESSGESDYDLVQLDLLGDDGFFADRILELDSNEESGENENEQEEIPLHQLVPLSTPAGQCKGPRYNLVMGRLEFLHDNGKWAEFSEFSKNALVYCKQAGLDDLRCVIYVEMGVAAYFKNDLTSAKHLFKQALKLAGRTGNPAMLEGRAKYWLAHLYRQKKKMGKAQEALDEARQILATHASFEDNAEVNYGYGNFLLALMTQSREPSIQTVSRAKDYFQREYQIVNNCQDQRIKNKKMRYALLRIAQLSLDCGNQSARERTVQHHRVNEAMECLNIIEREVWDDIPFGTEIEFWLARSDLCYRQEKYTRALEHAFKAHDMTQEREFEKHATKADERISHLLRFITKERIKDAPNDEFVSKVLHITDDSVYTSPIATE